MGRAKRRGRNLKQVEELIKVVRTNARTDARTDILTDITAIIKRNNAPSDSDEEGGLVRLTNEYLAWISPPTIRYSRR